MTTAERKKMKRRTKAATSAKGKASGPVPGAEAAATPAEPGAGPGAGSRVPPPMPSSDELQPFEQFAVDFLRARGAAVLARGPLEWEATLPADLARKWRRPQLRLVFDPERTTLSRGAQFAAPGSLIGLKLLKEARESGHLARFHAPVRPGVDARALAGEGLVLHDVDAADPVVHEPRWIVLVGFHMTVTFTGGNPEQDLRSVLADPRGPVFDFWEPEERKRAGLVPEIPEGIELEPIDRAALWAGARTWLERVLEPRAERWRKRTDEGRDRDLARLNTFYQTRIQEERDRRRRRRSEDGDGEEPTTEAALKLEWGRRTKAVRTRYDATIDIRLWGIEEIARPRQPISYPLVRGGKKVGTLEVEVDLGAGALVRPPCPVCGRAAGEFWWEDAGLVCRRCRGRRRSGAGSGTRARKGG
ncbi:MAG: hypothetical protein ACREOU_13055 [Candidatus Eiseniibacteriota bacterium]